MNKINWFIIVISIVALVSCRKDSYLLYDTTNPARLQFGPEYSQIYNKSKNFGDTLKIYTFANEPSVVVEDTVFFDIYAMGGTSDRDRFFILRQVDVANDTNAIEGLHYKAFSDPALSPAYVIKAGEIHSSVPVILFRDISLKSSMVVLKFEVVASQDFQPGETNMIWRKVKFTDRLVKPGNWDKYIGTLSVYSRVKHQFMIDVTGQKWDFDFLATVGPDFVSLNYWVDKVKVALAAYNDTHEPDLKDETGRLVKF